MPRCTPHTPADVDSRFKLLSLFKPLSSTTDEEKAARAHYTLLRRRRHRLRHHSPFRGLRQAADYGEDTPMRRDT